MGSRWWPRLCSLGAVCAGKITANSRSAEFRNIYTENLTTVEIPFTKTVKLGGNTAPGKTGFTIAVCDVNVHDLSYYTDVKYTAAVTTTGAGDYDGKLIIKRRNG